MKFKTLYEASKASDAIKTKEDVLKWLAMHNAESKKKSPAHLSDFEEENYEIHDDLTVDLIDEKARFVLDSRTFTGSELPIKFGRCDGLFQTSDTNISSMKNFPTEWGVESRLYCSNSPLKSLHGMSRFSGSMINLNDTDLTSFEGLNIDEEVDMIRAYTMDDLSSLKGLPAEMPKLSLYIGGHALTSLEHIPRKMHSLTIRGCKNLTSLVGLANKIDELESISFDKVDVQTGILGLLKIKGLRRILIENCSTEFTKAVGIVKKYWEMEELDIAECMDELIDNDLDDYAKL